MKNFLMGLLLFAMGMAFCWGLMSGASDTQALREVAENDCSIAKAGSHCKMADGKEAVIITVRRGK